MVRRQIKTTDTVAKVLIDTSYLSGRHNKKYILNPEFNCGEC